jgi:hypothetical protein
VTVYESTVGTTNWNIVKEAGNSATSATVAANGTVTLLYGGWDALRLTSGSAEGAERTFNVSILVQR